MRIGTSEIHTSDTSKVIDVPQVHFAIEVEDWDGLLEHLDSVGVPCSRTAAGAFTGTGGDDSKQGQREDTGEHYTYIHDPDGNLIELVYHPQGLEDSQGGDLELVSDPQNVRWTQIPGFVEAAYKGEPVQSA